MRMQFLNLLTSEPVNGYLIVYQICFLRTITHSLQFVSIQSGFIRPQALDTTVIEYEIKRI